MKTYSYYFIAELILVAFSGETKPGPTWAWALASVIELGIKEIQAFSA